jgi:hypothetical protein
MKPEERQFVLNKSQEKSAQDLLLALRKCEKTTIKPKQHNKFSATLQQLVTESEDGFVDLNNIEEAEEEEEWEDREEGEYPGEVSNQGDREAGTEFSPSNTSTPETLQSKRDYFETKGYHTPSSDDATIQPLLHKFAASLFTAPVVPSESQSPFSDPLLAFVIIKHYINGDQWTRPSLITPVLAKLKYGIRTTIFREAVDLCMLGHSASVMLEWVKKGKNTVFSWLSDQQTRISNVVFNTPTREQFLPSGNDPDRFLFNGELMRWSDLKRMAQAILAETEKLLIEVYSEIGVSAEELPFGPCADDHNDVRVDHCFLNHVANRGLSKMKELFLSKLLANKAYVRTAPNGEQIWDKISWLELEAKIVRLPRLAMTATYLLSGGLARRTEIAQMLWKNAPGRPRDWVWSDGNGLWMQTYMKTSVTRGIETVVARAQPPRLSFVLYHLLVGIRPVELFIQAKFGEKSPDFLRKYNWFMWAAGGKVLDTDDINTVLRIFSRRYLGVTCTISKMRQIWAYAKDEFFADLQIFKRCPDLLDFQCGRGSSVSKAHYGRTSIRTSKDIAAFIQLSKEFHKKLGVDGNDVCSIVCTLNSSSALPISS